MRRTAEMVGREVRHRTDTSRTGPYRASRLDCHACSTQARPTSRQEPPLTHDHSTVAVFNTDAPAEAAIRRLFEAGFPIERLSIIGNGSQTEARLVGF